MWPSNSKQVRAIDKKNAIFGSLIAVALLVAGAWWMGWFHREDPLVVQTKAVMEKPREEQSKEDRDALRSAWDERTKGMTPEQRQAMFETMMPIMVPIFMQRFEQEYDKFIVMSPAEQQKKLDERIDAMQKGMRNRPEGGMGGGPGGGGGRPQMDPKKMGEFQKKLLAYTTPEQRSKFDNGIRMFTNRMKERGLTPPPMPGGGFF